MKEAQNQSYSCPLSLTILQNYQTCGIWGDTNGGERDASFVGEASLAAGELTFGVGAVNGTKSHDPNDVLYIAMTGAAAVPGKTGASWNATTKEQFAASINAQCLKVAARVQPDAACSWAGHCAGMVSLQSLSGFWGFADFKYRSAVFVER